MSTTQVSEAIAAYCQEHLGDMLTTLERLVNIDSCSPNPRGVDAVADVLEAGLREAGCVTERVPPPKAAEEDWLADFFVPEIGSFDLVANHLVGRLAGDGAGHALLIGHMDTAFPFGEPERNPFRVEGDRALGCSIVDMKGGLVTVLYAVKALAATGVTAPRITVLYDSDEQAGSLTARKLVERFVREDGVTWAFKAEMARQTGPIVNRRPALGVGLVEVEGIERHVGTGFWNAASAVYALAKKTVKLQELSDRERRMIVNVGEFHGGTRRNLVAGRAYAKLDIRARTQEDWDELTVKIRTIVEEESVSGTRGRVKLFNHRPAAVPTEKTEVLMETVRRAGADLGREINFVETSAGSDANFPAALGVPTLDGFGPLGGDVMTRDEWIDVQSLASQSALLATTLHRLATGG
jgi:glutamate carboxypeptidase